MEAVRPQRAGSLSPMPTALGTGRGAASFSTDTPRQLVGTGVQKSTLLQPHQHCCPADSGPAAVQLSWTHARGHGHRPSKDSQQIGLTRQEVRDMHTHVISPGMGTHTRHTSLSTGLNADSTKHAASYGSPREGNLGAQGLHVTATVRAGTGGVAHMVTGLCCASVRWRRVEEGEGGAKSDKLWRGWASSAAPNLAGPASHPARHPAKSVAIPDTSCSVLSFPASPWQLLSRQPMSCGPALEQAPGTVWTGGKGWQ